MPRQNRTLRFKEAREGEARELRFKCIRGNGIRVGSRVGYDSANLKKMGEVLEITDDGHLVVQGVPKPVRPGNAWKVDNIPEEAPD